jgi:hypothetical protein
MQLAEAVFSPSEPDNSFSACNQEGMAVNVLTRGVLLQAVASALSKAGLTTKVIGDETSTTCWCNVILFQSLC